MVRRSQDILAKFRNRGKGGFQVNILESARAKDLHLHLTCQSQNRRTVNLGVPEARHEIGGARPRNRQTRGRLTCELSIT